MPSDSQGKPCSPLSPLHVSQLLQSVCALVTPIPLLMLVTVLVLRQGFPTPTHPLIKMAGLSLFVLNVAAFGSKRRWMFAGPVLLLAALLVLCLAGLSPLAFVPQTVWLIAHAGLLLSLLNLGSVAKRLGLLRTSSLLVLGLVLGIYAESMYWRSGGEHLIAYPEAMLTGQVHADVLQQAAIVQMIDTYGLASTGVDGLVPLKYHNGSLWMAQALRRWCRFPALDFIAFGYGLLLVPLYVGGIFAGAAVIRAWFQNTLIDCEKENHPPLVFWLAGVVAVVGLFPFIDDPNHWNFNETILNSDSLLLAFALSAWLIAVVVIFYVSLPDHAAALPTAHKLGFILALPVALALVGLVKISQVYLLLALLLYLFCRLKWLRVWPAVAGIVLSLLVVAWQLHAEVGANVARFAPLRFDRIAPEWVPYFFIFYFYWAWLFLFLWARIRKVRNLADFSSAVRSRESLPVELVFAAVIAGLLPYLLIDFYSPAWKYFTEFHAVLASMLVAACLPRIRFSSLAARTRSGEFSLAESFGLILALAVCGHVVMTTGGSAYRMVKSIGEARVGLAGLPPQAWRTQWRSSTNRTRPTSTPLVTARMDALRCLQDLSHQAQAQTKDQRKTAALYVPKTNRIYWDMRQVGPGATPFIAVAESGLAMVNGLPEFEDIGWAAIAWGYPQYQLPNAPEVPANNLDQSVSKARQYGFQRLWVFEGLNPSGCDLKEITLN